MVVLVVVLVLVIVVVVVVVVLVVVVVDVLENEYCLSFNQELLFLFLKLTLLYW